MRYVEVPQPIQIKNLTTGEPITVDGSVIPWRMSRYLSDIVLPDPALGKGYKADLVRSTLSAAFKDAKPGDFVPIEDEHYEMVRGVIEGPESDTPPIVTMQLFPFQAAFVEASREKPKVLVEVAG
tara:strand:+ start:270 stop:644 length:375 start_codon:yes stop_codon:yes gene_type:complete